VQALECYSQGKAGFAERPPMMGSGALNRGHAAHCSMRRCNSFERRPRLFGGTQRRRDAVPEQLGDGPAVVSEASGHSWGTAWARRSGEAVVIGTEVVECPYQVEAGVQQRRAAGQRASVPGQQRQARTEGSAIAVRSGPC